MISRFVYDIEDQAAPYCGLLANHPVYTGHDIVCMILASSFRQNPTGTRDAVKTLMNECHLSEDDAESLVNTTFIGFENSIIEMLSKTMNLHDAKIHFRYSVDDSILYMLVDDSKGAVSFTAEEMAALDNIFDVVKLQQYLESRHERQYH